MDDTPNTPIWTAPRLVELSDARDTRNGNYFDTVEDSSYSPSPPP